MSEPKFPKTQGKLVPVGDVEHGTVYYIGLSRVFGQDEWLHTWMLYNSNGDLLSMEKSDKKLTKKSALKLFETWQPPVKSEGGYNFGGELTNITGADGGFFKEGRENKIGF